MTNSLHPRSDAAPRGVDPEISLVRILSILVGGRRIIAISTALAVVVGLAVALLRTQKFATTFSFVPQASTQTAPSGLASLAGQFGVSLGGAATGQESPQLYSDLLHSRAILMPIAADTVPAAGRRVPLAEFLRIQGSDRALVIDKTVEVLSTAVIFSSVATRTTGVISVSVLTRSPTVSLAIAQRLLDGVNDFNLTSRRTQAGEERRFTESQLTVARASLRVASDSLLRFLRANRQFGTASEGSVEHDRLQAEVALQQSLVASIAQQFEQARIREVRDTPVITVIERPILAVRPEARGRIGVMLAAVVIGLVLGVVASLAAYALHWLRTTNGDPDIDALRAAWSGRRTPEPR